LSINEATGTINGLFLTKEVFRVANFSEWGGTEKGRRAERQEGRKERFKVRYVIRRS
jgi:hypothetical protein